MIVELTDTNGVKQYVNALHVERVVDHRWQVSTGFMKSEERRSTEVVVGGHWHTVKESPEEVAKMLEIALDNFASAKSDAKLTAIRSLLKDKDDE